MEKKEIQRDEPSRLGHLFFEGHVPMSEKEDVVGSSLDNPREQEKNRSPVHQGRGTLK